MADTRTRIAQLTGLFPVTATGFTALFASGLALVVLGMQRVDRVLIVTGMAGALLFLLTLVLTVVGALVIARRVGATEPEPVQLLAGALGPTGFSVTVPFWLPLVDVRWTVTEPAVAVRLVQRGRSTHEHWIPVRRGLPDHVVRWFTVGDAFGLCAIRFRVERPLDARILPAEGSLRRVEVVQGLASGDQIAHPEGRPEGDLQDMRQYGAGDPIRYVLWKVFAKSRTLVVRKPERALSPVTRTAAYLVTSEHDQAAAGTAKTAIECGALGREWVFGADGTTDVARTRQEALPLLLASAQHPVNAGGSGLRTFLDSADSPRRIVVFAPARPGPWVEALLSFATTTRLEVVLCADQIEPARKRLDVRRLVLVPEAPEGFGQVVVDRATLVALCTRLAGVGELRVVDRKAGVVYAGAHIARLTRGAA